LLAVWWTLWIIAATGDRLAGRAAMRADTAEALRDNAIAFVVVDLLYAVTAILAIKVAIALTARLDERAKLGPPQRTQRFERHEEEANWFPQGGDGPPPPPTGQIRLRLVDMSRLNPETVMPPYFRIENMRDVAPAYRGQPALSAQEIEDVVSYLASLRTQ